jgi:hypothetical protein
MGEGADRREDARKLILNQAAWADTKPDSGGLEVEVGRCATKRGEEVGQRGPDGGGSEKASGAVRVPSPHGRAAPSGRVEVETWASGAVEARLTRGEGGAEAKTGADAKIQLGRPEDLDREEGDDGVSTLQATGVAAAEEEVGPRDQADRLEECIDRVPSTDEGTCDAEGESEEVAEAKE